MHYDYTNIAKVVKQGQVCSKQSSAEEYKNLAKVFKTVSSIQSSAKEYTNLAKVVKTASNKKETYAL